MVSPLFTNEVLSPYTFPAEPDIGRFLALRPHLVTLLGQGINVVERIFGTGTTVILQIHVDPEDDSEQLFALVQTTLTVDYALELLDRFDEQWWLDASLEARGDLTFDVGFV